VNKSDINALFQVVMSDLGYKGWRLRWTSADAYCWRSKQVIDICPGHSLAECKQLLLHEIAHIGVVESSGNQHTLRFWRHLQCLVRKYVNSKLDMYQKWLVQIYCPEFRCEPKRSIMDENEKESTAIRGYRMTARVAIKDRIRRLRREADGLEALLKAIDPMGKEDRLTPEADEALWSMMLRR